MEETFPSKQPLPEQLCEKRGQGASPRTLKTQEPKTEKVLRLVLSWSEGGNGRAGRTGTRSPLLCVSKEVLTLNQLENQRGPRRSIREGRSRLEPTCA